MTRNSLLNRLIGAFHDEEEETSEDIDRELEFAVKAIKEEVIDILAADDVLGHDWGEAGDKVFIMDLAPIYAVIGTRSGRLASATEMTCQEVFSRKVKPADGRGSFEGDGFFMRFVAMSATEGFQLAAAIVNEIGTRILGSRFQAIDAPALVVVADADAITNKDGSLNLEKAGAVIESGGLFLTMDAPAADAPLWLKQRWHGLLSGRGAASEEWQAIEQGATIAHAAAGKPKRDPEQWCGRVLTGRRKSFLPFKGPDRRVMLDRRGHGF